MSNRRNEKHKDDHPGEYQNPVFEDVSFESPDSGLESVTACVDDPPRNGMKKDHSSGNEDSPKSVASVSNSAFYDESVSAERIEDFSEKSLTSGHKLKDLESNEQMKEVIPEEEIFHQELILKIRKTMPLKNFCDEIRARRDLNKFLVSPTVLLDVTHTSLDEIVKALLTKLQVDLEVDEKITLKAAKAFFTFHDEHEESAGSVDHLRETIQGIRYRPEGASYEQSWLTTVCSLPSLKKSHVGIARLRNPLNLGNKSEEVTFVVAVIAPKKEKFTKNAVEIGRTFSTLMMDLSFRHKLSEATTEDEFKSILKEQSSVYKRNIRQSESSAPKQSHDAMISSYSFKEFGKGVCDDFKRRFPHYWSDFRDGIVGKHTLRKVAATVLFLYFACLLPDIAFGTLYEKSTNGLIDVTSCIVSQTIGGLLFALFSGQPMLVLLTTAPLALYVKVIKLVSDSFDVDFQAMYTMTGLWNCIFVILQALFNVSKYMKYSTRSTEEIFGFFIALAFCGDAIQATINNFNKNYHFLPTSQNDSLLTNDLIRNSSTNSSLSFGPECVSSNVCYRPETSILYLFLMLATLWVGITLLRFDKSQFLSATKREILADYALPISVIFLSFVGSYCFGDIYAEKFNYNSGKQIFVFPSLGLLSPLSHLGAAGLGLCLSCLFYVDQNVSAALVNAPENRLKKGPAYHWDLMIIGLINIPLSLFNLPWVHAALPHSPLHVKALADVEQHVSNVGVVDDRIVKVRETRLTTIFSHILIGLSLLIIPVLQYVPVAVLQGLFLYLGLTSFIGNQMFDRLILIFTEGSSYPPNHYVRKVPQKKLHTFTACQFFQLIIVALFGFIDLFYLKMIFPVIILFLMPIRHKILPKIIEPKYLAVLEG